MLKCMDRYIQNYDPSQVAEVDMNNISFSYDEIMTKQIATTFAQVMIIQCGAVEFSTLKDIKHEEE